jgi:integrase
MTAGGYRNAQHAGQALIKNKGGRGREEKTVYFTLSLDRYLHDYIRTERAKYDPHGRKRLEDLADHDPLFLTRTGKPYSRSAFYHHWNKLFAPAQQQFKKGKQVEFTAHDLRHLRATRGVTKLRKEAQGDRSVEAELLEGFRLVMGWRSPETMEIYLKTMNKRKALEALLADEEQQEQHEREMQKGMSQRPLEGLPQTRSHPEDFPAQGTPLPAHADEFSWYEHDE